MNLFRRRRNPAEPAENTFELQPPSSALKHMVRLPEISLTAGQKSILKKPLHPRVDRILQGIYADKAAAEHALKANRIINFPHGDSDEHHVVQDENGFWRIVPGPGPAKLKQFLDTL